MASSAARTALTTEASRHGSVSAAGAGAAAISAAVTRVGTIVFQGLSPAWTCAL